LISEPQATAIKKSPLNTDMTYPASNDNIRDARPGLSRLHLGAFDCAIPGWINTDITPHLWISRIPMGAWMLNTFGLLSDKRYAAYRDGRFRALRYVDLTKPLPFGDKSCDAVFSSHVFEHLFMDEVERLVPEIWRVLVPGGICRVVVPDLEKIVAQFDPEDPGLFIREIYEVGSRSAVKNTHHCGFTSASLRNLFLRCGFSRTRKCSYLEGDCPDIDRLDNRPESIFFEATK
jgi:SAM-dependent methyltransferase